MPATGTQSGARAMETRPTQGTSLIVAESVGASHDDPTKSSNAPRQAAHPANGTLRPFLLGKRLVRDGVISIQVFTAIHPQSSKLGHRRETGHGRTVLLLGFGFRCSLSEFLDHRINGDFMLLCDSRLQLGNAGYNFSAF